MVTVQLSMTFPSSNSLAGLSRGFSAFGLPGLVVGVGLCHRQLSIDHSQSTILPGRVPLRLRTPLTLPAAH